MEEKKQNNVITKKVEKQSNDKQNHVKKNNTIKANTKAINKSKKENQKNTNKEVNNKPKTVKSQEEIKTEPEKEIIQTEVTESVPLKENTNEKVQEKVTINVTVPKDKTLINNLITLFISFILFNIKWIKYKFEFFGYVSSASITILHSDMFDFSFLLGMSKIFAIISILLFFVTIINSFIKLDEHIPSLKSFNLDKNLIIFYYGSYAISLILALIGVLFTKYSYLTIGYALTLIGYVICAYLTFKKNILKEANKIKKDIS